MKKYMIYAAIAVAVFAGAVLLGRLFRANLERRLRAEILAEMVVERDTVFVRETTYVREPAPDPVIVEKPVKIYVDVPVPGDTVFVEVPARMVQRRYSGDHYQAWVSGLKMGDYEPKLDSVFVEKIYQTVTQTVTTPAPKAKPMRVGVEGFVTVSPGAENRQVSYGPAGYIKYSSNFFELKGWGGYDFASKSAEFGATVSLNIFCW